MGDSVGGSVLGSTGSSMTGSSIGNTDGRSTSSTASSSSSSSSSMMSTSSKCLSKFSSPFKRRKNKAKNSTPSALASSSVDQGSTQGTSGGNSVADFEQLLLAPDNSHREEMLRLFILKLDEEANYFQVSASPEEELCDCQKCQVTHSLFRCRPSETKTKLSYPYGLYGLLASQARYWNTNTIPHPKRASNTLMFSSLYHHSWITTVSNKHTLRLSQKESCHSHVEHSN